MNKSNVDNGYSKLKTVCDWMCGVVSIAKNLTSYWYLHFEVWKAFNIYRPNQIRWLVRNFIFRCKSQGLNPWNSETAEYRSRYIFSIREIIRFSRVDYHGAVVLLREALEK